MKILKIIATLFVGLSCLNSLAKPLTLMIEAERLQFTGNWGQPKMNPYGLIVLSQDNDASVEFTPSGTIILPEAGKYYVWARTFDHPKFAPKSRKANLLINGNALENIVGVHGKEGLEWELAGVAELPKGEALISIKPLAKSTKNIRFDVIAFSTDPNFNPVGKFATMKERSKYVARPSNPKLIFESELSKFPETVEIDEPKSFMIQNNVTKITFKEVCDKEGNRYFERSQSIFYEGQFFPLPTYKEELLFLTYSPDNVATQEHYFVSWAKATSFPKVKIQKKLMDIVSAPLNPYAVGENKILRPIEIKKDEGIKSLILKYPYDITAKISLPDNSNPIVKFEVSYNADKDGNYSFGFLGYNQVEESNFNNVQLPPLFMNRKLMLTPKMVSSDLTSQATVAIDLNLNGHRFTQAICIDPSKIPYDEWSKNNNSRYGFSISSPNSKIQAAIFQPVLGLVDSKKKAGEIVNGSWYMVVVDGDWTKAFELINEKIFHSSHLRTPYTASLSQALENICKYMKDADASGWSSHLKGRWNIEGQYSVTQANALGEISLAILTDDEEYYKNFALPTIEFSLSRYGSHFTSLTDTTNKLGEAYYLSVPGNFFKEDYYASLHKLLGSGNVWLKEFYSPEDRYKPATSVPEWATDFAVWLACPELRDIDNIKGEALAWSKKSFKEADTAEGNYRNFVNVSFYPYWWLLTDLYEATEEKELIEYVNLGAFYSMMSLWNYPIPPKGNVDIYKDGYVEGMGRFWWKGMEVFKLNCVENDPVMKKIAQEKGIPENLVRFCFPMKPQSADAWQVSRIGLGIEQPSTYSANIEHYRNILMPSWAPELLKAYQITNRDILNKFSRHAIIGRYANFLGYYIKDFTNIQHDPMYPYKGPDVTSFYYHHVPCHFAQTYDYLMTQVEQRSKNLIKFPHLRQQNYVWFTDRIFGQPGRVFLDEEVRPIISMGAVSVDTPNVSIVTGRAKDGIWIILLNDTPEQVITTLKFDKTKKFLNGVDWSAQAVLINNRGDKLAKSKPTDAIKIPELGLVAMKISASDYNPKLDQRPLSGPEHIVKKNVAENWGDMHAFRIRSPFGYDSLYVVLTAEAKQKGKVTLTLKDKTFVVDKFPYELSVYPLSQDLKMPFKVKIEEGGKTVYESELITIKD